MNWDESWPVGVAFMDEDHEHAIDMINQIECAKGGALAEVADQFYKHCVDHFAREEEMMVKMNFFAFPMHKGEHDRVLAELSDVVTALKEGASALNGEGLAKMLSDWLRNHRDTMDQVTASFANEAGGYSLP